jgi:hypothetical protein
MMALGAPVAFYPHSVLLLAIASAAAVTVETNGTSKTLSTHTGDEQSNAQQLFAAEFVVTIAAGGTSPTADASVETSWDKGVTWQEVAKMTQLSGAGTKKQVVDIEHLGPLVRAKVKPGGTAASGTSAAIRLVSSALLTAR